MRIERERINVKGESRPREVELKFTIHGPVIYEDPALRRAYALKWVGSEPGTAGYLASLTLNRVQNWDQFLKAMDKWKVPSENLIYADVDGNIGWVAAGMTPIRKGWSGLLPVPGADGRYEWQGFLPVSKMPQKYNPNDHFVATANHNILPPDYKYEFGLRMVQSDKIHANRGSSRTSNKKFSVADFQKLQHDELSLPARELTGILRGVQGAKPEMKQYVEMLTNWDCVLGRDSNSAALFEYWLTKLPAAIFKPKIPVDAWAVVAPRISLLKTIEALKKPDKSGLEITLWSPVMQQC
ncbi:MAG: penicillin acylase family protein [Acidobacteria bacterium]|nr:penicillin acylase family protein [Acidobacteriota bacterium]